MTSLTEKNHMILITRWMQKVDIECLKMYKYTSTLAKS